MLTTFLTRYRLCKASSTNLHFANVTQIWYVFVTSFLPEITYYQ